MIVAYFPPFVMRTVLFLLFLKYTSLEIDHHPCAFVSVGPLQHDTDARPELIGRDIPPLTASQRQQMWFDKMVELSQMINFGATGKTPSIPMQMFGLLDESKESGFYKVLAVIACATLG